MFRALGFRRQCLVPNALRWKSQNTPTVDVGSLKGEPTFVFSSRITHMSEHCPWYGTQRWRKRARAQLQNHPLCVRCLESGQIVAANAADHVVPHRGDQRLFWFGELQSLCTLHHNQTKQFEERNGYRLDVDDDGWPIDARHPANRRH